MSFANLTYKTSNLTFDRLSRDGSNIPMNESTASKSLKTTAYVALIILSLTGNSCVIACIVRNTNKRMRTVSNILIVNLCIADLLVTIFNMPGKLAQIYLGRIWLIGGTFGFVLCKMMNLIPYLGVAVSTQSFTVLAVDRFVAVFFPIKKPITAKVANVLILAMWLFSFGFFYVYFHSSEIMLDSNNNTICGLDIHKVFLTADNQRKFIWAEFTILTVIPLTTSAVFYTATMTKLLKRKIPGTDVSANTSYTERVNRRVLKMLVTVYLAFFLCWLPSWVWVISCLQNEPKTKLSSFCLSRKFHIVRFMVAYTNSAINPFIYLIFSENYRQGFKDVLGAIVCCPGLKAVLRGRNRVGPPLVADGRSMVTRSRLPTRIEQTVI